MISSIKSTDILRLHPWEEATGKLESIVEENGSSVALVGKIRIAIPFDFKQQLLPYLGSTISMLRTEDIPECEYLFRVLDSDTSCDEKFSEGGLEHGWAGH